MVCSPPLPFQTVPREVTCHLEERARLTRNLEKRAELTPLRKQYRDDGRLPQDPVALLLSSSLRSVLLEARHFCQTFCLVATWLGLAP